MTSHGPAPAIFYRMVDEAIDAVVIMTGECIIRYVNPALERLAGYGAGELLGQSLNGLLPEPVARHHDSYLRKYLAGLDNSKLVGQVRQMALRHRNGALLPVELKALDLGASGGERLFGAVIVDRSGPPGAAPVDASGRTELRRLQQFRSESADIMEQIARDVPLERTLHEIARVVEAYEPQFVCTIMLMEPETGRLRHGASPSLADTFAYAAQPVLLDGVQGRRLSQAAQARDIAKDPAWAGVRAAAQAHGLHSWWALPVLADDRLLGALVLHSVEARRPPVEQGELHRWCCRLASVAIGRHNATTRLRSSEQRFRAQASLLDHTQDAILTLDAHGIVTFWNRAAQRLFGWTRAEALGQPGATLLLEEGSHLDEALARVRVHGEAATECRVYARGGHLIQMEARLSLVPDDGELAGTVLAAFSDIGARKQAEGEIHYLAFHDQLTHLPNRRLLGDRLQHALVSSQRTGQWGAALLIDLDNFKTINDTLGHQMGDVLLGRAAERLQTCVRASDTVARIGGDEFAVLLEDLGTDQGQAAATARQVGQKLVEALGQPYEFAGCEHVSTASIGIALFGAQSAGAEALLREADLSMYRAKGEGRNGLRFFDPQMQVELLRRSELQGDLRHALRDGGLALHFQPQVDAAGRIYGAEALLRWRHPVLGYVPPGEFIPLAEETGLMNELGQRVLEMACNALLAWERVPAMRHLCLAVNVSMHQFRRVDFAESVLQVLRRSGADPRKLKLEITESVFADDLEGTVARMMALRVAGISFAIDDFGTGYSSLSYLKRLPLDQLKIDQSFVRDILSDANDASIARTIITLAHTLGLHVIAEGVETSAQRDLLMAHGCAAFQGYYFGRPVPDAEFSRMLAAVAS
ncbi:sensor domain-containing protein [Zemynaea arenosa]|nr:EAL domain-containing protein [Massilia arenosa]